RCLAHRASLGWRPAARTDSPRCRTAIHTQTGSGATSRARPENLTLDNSFENWDWPEKSHNERPNRLLHECHVKRLDAYLEDAVRPRLGSRLCGRFRSGEPAASL
ncbi:unnamed protein product, partial [Effrenium voratum]